MKKTLLVAFVILSLVCGIIGMSTSASAKPSTKVIKLKFSHMLPPSSPQVIPWLEWGEKVEEFTGGRVKIIFYPSSSLVQFGSDNLAAMDAGVCDICWEISWIQPKFEFLTIFDLPCLGWENDNLLSVRKQVETEFPPLPEVRSCVKTLWLEQTALENLHLVKKQVRVPEDMKGLRLISTPTGASYFKVLGVVSTTLNTTDQYGALEKGMVDGIQQHGMGLYEWKMDEVTHYHLYVPIISTSTQVIMSLKKWDSLPIDIKHTIDNTLAEVEKADMDAKLEIEKKLHDQLIVSKKHTVIKPAAKELTLWQEKALSVHRTWIKNMTAKGYPAQDAYDKLIDVINR